MSFRVLAASKPLPNDPHLRIVLCEKHGGQEFTVHTENLQDSATLGRLAIGYGRYHRNVIDASDCFKDRCAEYGVEIDPTFAPAK